MFRHRYAALLATLAATSAATAHQGVPGHVHPGLTASEQLLHAALNWSPVAILALIAAWGFHQARRHARWAQRDSVRLRRQKVIMVSPIRITCTHTLPVQASELSRRILDLSEWPNFEGWGPLPGIRAARFRHQTDACIGSVIEVENRDRSTHTEEIMDWVEGRVISLRLANFTAPVRHLASHFDEHWLLEADTDRNTRVTRCLEIHPRGALARLMLTPIALMLHKALQKHLDAL
jgi:hypothetical protein